MLALLGLLLAGAEPSSHKQCMEEGPRTAEELPGNASFLSSREYKEMAAFIGARHDIADLRQRFSQDGYVVFKPKIPESVLAGAAAFTEKVFKTCITVVRDARAR